MSDSQILVVDVSATAEESAELGRRIIDWLHTTGVVDPTRPAPTGWPDIIAVGPRWRDTCAATPSHEPTGVTVDLGPMIHTPVENVGSTAACPHCDARFGMSAWIDAAEGVLTAWVHGSGDDVVACPECRAAVRVHEWRWPDGEPWAAGTLAVAFWNWPPPLREDFLSRMRAVLDGHDLRVINVHM